LLENGPRRHVHQQGVLEEQGVERRKVFVRRHGPEGLERRGFVGTQGAYTESGSLWQGALEAAVHHHDEVGSVGGDLLEIEVECLMRTRSWKEAELCPRQGSDGREAPRLVLRRGQAPGPEGFTGPGATLREPGGTAQGRARCELKQWGTGFAHGWAVG